MHAFHISCSQQIHFFNSTALIDDIKKAGECALVLLYNSKFGDTVDELRYKSCEKLATNSVSYYSCSQVPLFRVYYQIQTWDGLDNAPEKWGWELIDGQ